jgi:hypothetical protein
MANPRYVTLVADTDTPVTLDANYGAVEVSLIANGATTQFNATGTAIASSTLTDGNHALTTTLLSKTVIDGTAGAASVVHLRSSGTPTVAVYGL